MTRGWLTLFGFLIVLVVWTILQAQHQNLEDEIAALEMGGSEISSERSVRTRRFFGVSDVSLTEREQGILRGRHLLPKVEVLTHLSNDDLKSLAEDIIKLQESGALHDNLEGHLLYRPVMRLICRLEPEWFLEKVLERSRSGSQVRLEKMATPIAFESFLRMDRDKALRWYEDGLEDRTHHFFEKFGMRDVAVAALLKFDPERAYDVMSRFQKRMPEGSQFFSPGRVARLDTLSQVELILEKFPRGEREQLPREIERFLVLETYRLGGRNALGNLISEQGWLKLSELNEYAPGDYGKHKFWSPEGIRDLMELSKNASLEVRAELIASVCGSWAVRDCVAAQSFVLEMPQGEVRQRSVARLIRAMAGFNANGARLLLSEVESLERRTELEAIIRDYKKRK